MLIQAAWLLIIILFTFIGCLFLMALSRARRRMRDRRRRNEQRRRGER